MNKHLIPDRSPCNDCGAVTGEAHDYGCDVARCVHTGVQALQCMGEDDVQWLVDHGYDPAQYDEAQHPGTCGGYINTGLWPGYVECVEWGWYCRWGPPWIECEPDHPDAGPDLNKLGLMAARGIVVWSMELQRYVAASGGALYGVGGS